jgi:hypothetical protein
LSPIVPKNRPVFISFLFIDIQEPFQLVCTVSILGNFEAGCNCQYDLLKKTFSLRRDHRVFLLHFTCALFGQIPSQPRRFRSQKSAFVTSGNMNLAARAAGRIAPAPVRDVLLFAYASLSPLAERRPKPKQQSNLERVHS